MGKEEAHLASLVSPCQKFEPSMQQFRITKFIQRRTFVYSFLTPFAPLSLICCFTIAACPPTTVSLEGKVCFRGGNKLLVCCLACCAIRASITTNAAIASTIGTARGTTQGSCLPFASNTPDPFPSYVDV